MAEHEGPPWRELLGMGLLLLILTFFPGWAPSGPWGEQSFTRGLVGLVGGSMVYVAWYRYTFNTHGIIPVVSMWREPKKSTPRLAIIGAILVIASKFIGQYLEFVPIPFTLIMTLIGLLMLLLAGYAWLILEGPLRDCEEE